MVREAESEASAAYRLRPRPGAELLAAALDAAGEAEFSLHWVTRPWSFERYAIGVEAIADVRHAHRETLAAHLAAQRRTLEERVATETPEVYLCVRLVDDRAPGTLGEAERRVRRRLLPWLDCARASESDLRWLTRRACRRGLPDLPGRRPRHSTLVVGTRSLRVCSELGTSHQVLLRLEPPPGDGADPSSAVEGLLAPLELPRCPVDLALSAAPAVGEPSDGSPALRVVLSLRVAAASATELERQIELLRRELAPMSLRRPAGEQLALFFAHLPGLGSRATPHRERLRSDRIGAMLPRPAPELGTAVGPYIGRRTDGAPRGVRFDPAEVGRASSSLVLVGGYAGSGKTLLLQLIMHHAFLTGSVVFDIDLGGNHVLHRLARDPECARVVELADDPSVHGLLDPLGIAPPALREELACSLLVALLPVATPPQWQTAVRLAVRAVGTRGGRCGEVIDELARRPRPGPEVARALADRADSPPARLAIGNEAIDPREVSVPQLAVIRIPGLVPARPGSTDARGDALRLRRTLANLLVLYALQLGQNDPPRQVVLSLDPAAELLSDHMGRKVLRQVDRVARARPITALLATRALDGAQSLGRIGAAFCFRAGSDGQAAQALRLLDLDQPDPLRLRALRSLEPGRCLMRDPAGRTGEVQIEVPNPELAAGLGITPDLAA